MEVTKSSRRKNCLSDTEDGCRSTSGQIKGANNDSVDEGKLFNAALKGDFRSVRALIQSGEDLNYSESRNGYTPIYGAISSKNVWMLQELIDAGADVNLRNETHQTTPFIFAVSKGIFEVVKVLLCNGADIHTRFIGQFSALHISALNGFVKVSKLLIERGLDVDIRNEQDVTPLHIAANVGETEMVQLLLSKGADISATCTYERESKKDKVEFGSNVTAVFLASDQGYVDIVNILIKAGADVNVRTSENLTALHVSAENGHLKLMNMLLKAGAGSRVNLQSNFNSTPLLLAVKNGHVDVIKVLFKVEGIEVNPVTLTMETPLATAAHYGLLEIAKLLVAKGALVNGRGARKRTPLHAALKYGKNDVAEFLIELGADILATDSDDITPLHDACRGNVSIDIIRALVKKGANVNGRSLEGATPLHHAAMGGSVKIVSYLVKRVLEIDAICLLQTTPLHCAVKAGHLAVVKILLKSDANVNLQDESKNTPLHIALKEGHVKIAKLLVKLNASVNLKEENESCTPLFLAVKLNHDRLVNLLVDKGADVNVANKFGVLPIHVAAKVGNVEIVKVLLTKGASYNTKAKADSYSGTPLEFARDAGNVKLIVILEIIKRLFCAVINNNLDQVVLCIEAGAIVNARNFTGQTALHYAVSNYNSNAVEALLTGGADITLATDKGELPLQIAVGNGCITIPEILLAHAKSLGFVKYNSVIGAKTKEGGDTALHTAAENNKLHIVKFLLASGAVYNVKNYSGQTALELTTNEAIVSLLISAEKLFEAVKKEDGVEEVKQILKGNSSAVNAREVDIGGTPLYWSILKGHTIIANELLSSGADYCLVTNDGTTPLHNAASKGNVEIVKVLINRLKNADVGKVKDFINARTTSGTAALHVASNVEIVKCLLQAGATYDVCNGELETALELTQDDNVRRLLKTTHQIFKDMRKGESTVMSTLNSLELEEFKAVTSARNRQGQSLVQVALANGRLKFASEVLEKLK